MMTINQRYAFGLALALAACGGPAQSPDDAPDATDMPSMDGAEDTQDMEGMDMPADAGPTVRLQPGQAERIGLRWAEAELKPIRRTTRTSAVIEYPESEMIWVSPRISGWVERLHVTFEGAAVRRGAPLLEIYSPDLVTAQEELLLARRLEDDLAAGRPGRGTDSLFALAARRLAYWNISEAQVERLLETGEVRKTLTLHSPATGIVTKKQVFEGQGVKAGENLLMISPTDPVWVDASIYEQDLSFVRTGMPVAIDVKGLPGEVIQGRVTFLYPNLREGSRTLTARIELPNPEGRLLPGMYATVQIESRSDEPVLSVPSSAILHTGTRDVAFMDMGENQLMPMVVRTGRMGDERVEILEGLSEGDRVAISAQFLLDSESNLMEAMQAMMAQMGRSGADMDGMEGMDETDDTAGTMDEMEGMEDR